MPAHPASNDRRRSASPHTEYLAQARPARVGGRRSGLGQLRLYDDLREDQAGFVYLNPEEHICVMRWTWRARYRFHPAYAIYEPGFLRLGATLHWRCSCPAPIYRFMFSSDYTFSFPPDDYGLTAYLNLMDQVAPGAQWMVAGLGVDVLPLIPRVVAGGRACARGSGGRALGCAKRTNLQWWRQPRRRSTTAAASWPRRADPCRAACGRDGRWRSYNPARLQST